MVIVSIFMLILSFVPYGSTKADDCTDVFVLFARGSGQPQFSKEKQKPTYTFFDEINARKPQGISVESRELIYPAQGGLLEIADAEFSWLAPFASYHDSETLGVFNTVTTLNRQAEKCPQQRFVLGGYSQGAHVIGDSLSIIGNNLASRVVFVGLFGDPKFNPGSYAARGDFTSKAGGLLEPRTEFPDLFLNKLQSWCRKGDGICENNYRTAQGKQSAHPKYPEREIPIVANNVADKLKAYFPGFGLKSINDGEKVDIMYVISTSSQMKFPLDNLRANREAITAATYDLANDTRTGIVAFNDTEFGCEVKEPQTRMNLVDDPTEFNNQLNQLFGRCGGGGGDPYNGDDVYSAIQRAIDSQLWRSDAKKLLVLLATNKPNAPDKYNSSTNEQTVISSATDSGIAILEIVRASLLIDPVYDDLFTVLAEQTGGGVEFGRYPSNRLSFPLDEHLLHMLKELTDKPVAAIAPVIPTQPGQAVTFNAGGSYDPDSSIISYEWDFDNDGNPDRVTPLPVTSYVYNDVYEGRVLLKVTSSDGGTATNSAQVSVNYTNAIPSPPKAPNEVLITLNQDNSAQVSWSTPDGVSALSSAALPDNYLIKRADGAVLGVVDGSTTSVKITDLPVGEPIQVAVTAGNEIGNSTPSLSQQVMVEEDSPQSGGSDGSSGEVGNSVIPFIAKSLVSSTITAAGGVEDAVVQFAAPLPGDGYTEDVLAQQTAKNIKASRPFMLLLIGIGVVATGIWLIQCRINRLKL